VNAFVALDNMTSIATSTPTALIIIDVQQGFTDPVWGAPDNPAAEANIASLRETRRTAAEPVVLVRHDSREPGSPLAPGSDPGGGTGGSQIVRGPRRSGRTWATAVPRSRRLRR